MDYMADYMKEINRNLEALLTFGALGDEARHLRGLDEVLLVDASVSVLVRIASLDLLGDYLKEALELIAHRLALLPLCDVEQRGEDLAHDIGGEGEQVDHELLVEGLAPLVHSLHFHLLQRRDGETVIAQQGRHEMRNRFVRLDGLLIALRQGLEVVPHGELHGELDGGDESAKAGGEVGIERIEVLLLPEAIEKH